MKVQCSHGLVKSSQLGQNNLGLLAREHSSASMRIGGRHLVVEIMIAESSADVPRTFSHNVCIGDVSFKNSRKSLKEAKWFAMS